MAGEVVTVVLLAALLHASWNALVKAGPDKYLSTLLVACGAGLVSLPLLPLAALPHADSWPWLVASACCQVIYYRLLAAAYRHGDMSQAYPLMRGAAPLLVALASVPLLGERLHLRQDIAVMLICGGVLTLTILRGARAGADTAANRDARRRATGYALLNAAVIATYTMIDAVGVRRSGTPAGYTMWLFVLTAVLLLLCSANRWAELPAYARRHARVLLLGGGGTLASYGLALWAMTLAPVAAVAALRETSILFAAVIAAVFLRERLAPGRIVAVSLIACGAIVMRLG
ncbi:EamA family transporter [Duganella dendranthematis]|uniref:EamA family transporter n=1 Tax=Duganella dendranthematis TaxID=2728021 RepID=A0ABX6M4Y0_9BURK|nr:DMT family transporter [Duganella dendranthematis]QJD89348.1 EamA family transporter [Duganella dendranthematis]